MCVVQLRLLLLLLRLVLLLVLLWHLLWLAAAWLRRFVSQRPRDAQYVSFMELVHDNIQVAVAGCERCQQRCILCCLQGPSNEVAQGVEMLLLLRCLQGYSESEQTPAATREF